MDGRSPNFNTPLNILRAAVGNFKEKQVALCRRHTGGFQGIQAIVQLSVYQSSPVG
jgi:hypothetical protein